MTTRRALVGYIELSLMLQYNKRGRERADDECRVGPGPATDRMQAQ